jgi:hypothetical protein
MLPLMSGSVVQISSVEFWVGQVSVSQDLMGKLAANSTLPSTITLC